MRMADTGFAEYFDAPAVRPGLVRRLVSALFSSGVQDVATDGTEVPRRLAGPLPGDRRARGYMADLDMEAGF